VPSSREPISGSRIEIVSLSQVEIVEDLDEIIELTSESIIASPALDDSETIELSMVRSDVAPVVASAPPVAFEQAREPEPLYALERPSSSAGLRRASVRPLAPTEDASDAVDAGAIDGVPVDASRPPLDVLASAVEEAPNPRERASARLRLARAHIEADTNDAAEPLLWSALADGSIEAGDLLAVIFESTPNKTAELVRVRQELAERCPGDSGRLDALAAATLAAHRTTHARAVEHVSRAFDAGAGPLPPPPLDGQSEHPGLLALLARPVRCPAGEALALVWEHSGTALVKNPSAYALTGMERLAAGTPSPVARLAERACRLIGMSPVPLYARRAAHALTGTVALLSPAAAFFLGEARDESLHVRHVVGTTLASALPENALMCGSSGADGRALWHAVLGAFGPREFGRDMDKHTLALVETLWQVLPGAVQRRISALLATPQRTDYEVVVERARQSCRRFGLFMTGDFGFSARLLLEEAGMDSGVLMEDGGVARMCAELPALRDLYSLALSPDFAETRWQPLPPPSMRGESGGAGARTHR
jgi:hypothetical protein